MQAEADMTADDDGLEPAQQEPHPVAATQALALTVGFSKDGDDALPEETEQQRAVAERAVQQSADGEWSDSAGGEYLSPLAMSMAQYTDAWAHDDVPMDHGGSASNSKMEVRAGDATWGARSPVRRAHAGYEGGGRV
jgi:hypothetical protein